MKPQGFSPLGGLETGFISMGAEGLHPLFESAWIRRAFDSIEAGGLCCDQLLMGHQALKKLARLRRMDSKRRFLDALPPQTVDTLVFLYFRSLDQFLESREPTIH